EVRTRAARPAAVLSARCDVRTVCRSVRHERAPWPHPDAAISAEQLRRGADSLRHVDEPGLRALGRHGNVHGRSRTVLGDDDVGLAGALVLLVVHVLTMDEQDQVRILRDRTGLTQVGYHRTLVRALLAAAVELGQGDDRDLEFLGQKLERAGELRDLLLTGFDALARGHQLQVVHADHAEIVLLFEPATLRTDLRQ